MREKIYVITETWWDTTVICSAYTKREDAEATVNRLSVGTNLCYDIEELYLNNTTKRKQK